MPGPLPGAIDAQPDRAARARFGAFRLPHRSRHRRRSRLKATTRVKVRPSSSGVRAVEFDISPLMTVDVGDGGWRPAEVLQRESPPATHARRQRNVRGGSRRATGSRRDYEFVFEHSGKVVFDTGDRVLFVTARGNCIRPRPAVHDLRSDFPAPKIWTWWHPEICSKRAAGDSRVTHFRCALPSGRRLTWATTPGSRGTGGYVVEVCANRALERD